VGGLVAEAMWFGRADSFAPVLLYVSVVMVGVGGGEWCFAESKRFDKKCHI
jgi:hypothetical protein